mgnify:CR=1 FL=1
MTQILLTVLMGALAGTAVGVLLTIGGTFDESPIREKRESLIRGGTKYVWDGSTPRCWAWRDEGMVVSWQVSSIVCSDKFGPWESAWDGDTLLGYKGDK